MSLEQFAEKWTSADYPPEPVAEVDLQLTERRLVVRLPEEYRRAILAVGRPRPTIALLNAIVERELDLHSVCDFYSPQEIVEETLGWREIGMPEQLIAFASDDCGNKFCFDGSQLESGAPDAGAIWFFDHDFGTTDQIAIGFEAWIDALGDVEPWPEAEPS